MALSDLDIKKCLVEGLIVIEPFNEKQLNNCSYDVTLGENVIRANILHNHKPINPWSSSYDQWCETHETPMIATFEDETDLPIGTKYFIIEAGELVLAHTNEFIGTRWVEGMSCLTTMMKARSSVGRCGVTVCCCAGLGDPGYHTRWAMEVKNHFDRPIILPVGMRIAQIVFLQSGITDNPYTKNGNYQNSDSVLDLMKNWTPSQLYPRFYKNYDADKFVRTYISINNREDSD